MATNSTYAGWVREGKTYDIEDSRATDRMHATIAVLESLGATRTVEHNGSQTYDWPTRRMRHECDAYPRCKVTWPEWVTDEMFDKAWSLVSEMRTARGEYNRRPR